MMEDEREDAVMADNKMDKLKEIKNSNALSLEELENIGGGSGTELAEDCQFLNVLLSGHSAQPSRYTEDNWKGSDMKHALMCGELAAAWRACGVVMKNATNGSGSNTYLDLKTRKPITRRQAQELAMSNIGRQLHESDWKW